MDPKEITRQPPQEYIRMIFEVNVAQAPCRNAIVSDAFSGPENEKTLR